MRTASQTISLPDLRHRRAMSLTALVLRIVDDHTREIRDDNHFMRDISDALMDAFMAQGVDILTDYDREQLGLPPRGPNGWTIEEMVAMEKKRLALMRAPMPPVIVSSDNKLI